VEKTRGEEGKRNQMMALRFQTGGGNQTSLVRGVSMKDGKNTLNKVGYILLSPCRNLFDSNQNNRKHHK